MLVLGGFAEFLNQKFSFFMCKLDGLKLWYFRTGTFVAIEMAMEKLRKNEACIVVDVTRKLREQRLHAVQNDLVS